MSFKALQYEPPFMELLAFSPEDVITSSTGGFHGEDDETLVNLPKDNF